MKWNGLPMNDLYAFSNNTALHVCLMIACLLLFFFSLCTKSCQFWTAKYVCTVLHKLIHRCNGSFHCTAATARWYVCVFRSFIHTFSWMNEWVSISNSYPHTQCTSATANGINYNLCLILHCQTHFSRNYGIQRISCSSSIYTYIIHGIFDKLYWVNVRTKRKLAKFGNIRGEKM